jgi:hypothetical protein
MNAEMLQLIGNMVSVIADAMTLIGLGGILTWGFVRKGSSRFADQIVDVFFFSIRLFLLFPITLIFLFLGSVPYLFAYLILRDAFGLITGDAPLYWDQAPPIGYLTAYLIAGLVVVPLYLTICSCVLLWSMRPLESLVNRFLGRSRATTREPENGDGD